MAKLIIWIVEDSEELTKSWLKNAVNQVFQHDECQSCWAETLHLMHNHMLAFCYMSCRYRVIGQ